MGIGKKNPNFSVLESQYNTSYPFFAPQEGDQSYFVDLSNHFVFEMWQIAVIGVVLLVLIIIIYILICKVCCKKEDFDEGESIDAISSTDVLKQIKVEERKEGKREIKGLNRKNKKGLSFND